MDTTTTRLWDRLEPAEKAALTRAWKRYAEVAVTLPTQDEGPEYRLTEIWRAASALTEAAKLRESYLRSLVDVWHRHTFRGNPAPVASLPPELFEQGQDLDDVLWEQHPSNLLDLMAEEADL